MRSFVVAVSIAAFSLVGCSSKAPDAGAVTTQAAVDSSDLPAELLAGTYEYIAFPKTTELFSQLTLRANGRYTATRPGAAPESGTFRATESTLTLTGEHIITYSLETQDDGSAIQITGDGAVEVLVRTGDAPEEPPTGGGPGGDDKTFPIAGDCDSRTGGAFVTFEHAGETFTLWTTNTDFIRLAKDRLESHERFVPMFEQVLEGADCDEHFGFHVDPARMEIAELATEVCDSTKSMIDNAWVKNPGNWCPWDTAVTKVVPQP